MSKSSLNSPPRSVFWTISCLICPSRSIYLGLWNVCTRTNCIYMSELLPLTVFLPAHGSSSFIVIVKDQCLALFTDYDHPFGTVKSRSASILVNIAYPLACYDFELVRWPRLFFIVSDGESVHSILSEVSWNKSSETLENIEDWSGWTSWYESIGAELDCVGSTKIHLTFSLDERI